ncbi:M20/M25/M40 family metallo-hydrolase [Halorussus gelatinilyticus]|uniref:M20/M25/M40 family metallo-hydrolase n=1 Tax=Halorussus gelatinilyticus TaxID=2937524 RepID=A0A8U0INH3_9EURY|nr:M20/M25/M40 family metallo-hydrolase [Halorussus gelatinilyticus]UPW02185.1 M20/M25/M40 family metallo-hydrolase [Halorussus gelatinilyticus]
MNDFAREWDDDLREFAEELLRFDTTGGDEAPAQEFVRERLDELGFETYEWTADAEELAGHDSFPDDPDEIPVADRPSVGGVLELGDPDAGPTLVLNGHVDVVPAARESWSSDPFDPTWREAERGDGETLTARGAADMKCGLSVCVFAAKHLHERADALDGRLVVESVVGEEAGGVGAAAAALSNPYPFERDAGIIAEPTDLRPVVASEGSLMKRLRIGGRSAHAATRWRGVDVLPYFEEIRRAFRDLETERGERVTHPLYDDFPVPLPVVVGRVEAGDWASSVPAELTAELRIGVTPGETVAEVEETFERRLAELVADDDWLAEHPPEFERFSVQFEPSEIDPDEPVVGAVQRAMRANGFPDSRTEPQGATYGADSRWYIEAGIPTVMFGPGHIEQAHFPDETIPWDDVLTAGEVLADAAEAFLD